MNRKYYYILGLISSWLWASAVFAEPSIFTNANDFIKDKSKVITFEIVDGQTSPSAISSQFSNVSSIIFEGSAKIVQADTQAINGAPVDGTSYLRLKSNYSDHPFSRVRIVFNTPVDSVGAYWGGVDKGIVGMVVTLTDGSPHIADPFTELYNILPSTSTDKCKAINGFIGIDSNYGKKIKELLIYSVGDTVSIDNLYFGDAVGQRYGAGETLLPSAFYKSQCETTISPSPTEECIVYGVNDKSLNNSEFFFIKPEDHFSVTPLNSRYDYNGYDIEGLDIHPTTGELFASSGNNTAYNQDKGHLFKVHKKHGGLEPIGSTGFDEVASLSFHPNGSLWGWAKGVGLIQIDTNTAQSTIQLDSDVAIEDMSWSTDGNILYATAGNALYAYYFDSKELIKKCESFPNEVEAIDTLEDGSLLFSLHQNDDSSIHAFDIESCSISATAPIATTFTDIEGIASNCN